MTATEPTKSTPRAVLSDRHNWSGDAKVLRDLANHFAHPASEATASYLHRLADRLTQIGTPTSTAPTEPPVHTDNREDDLMAVYEEPRFYQVLRDLATSGDARLREVRAGRAIADARTLIRDRDALAEALRDAEAEATRWRSLALKLADMEVQDFLTYAGSMSVNTIIERVHDLSEKFGAVNLSTAEAPHGSTP